MSVRLRAHRALALLPMVAACAAPTFHAASTAQQEKSMESAKRAAPTAKPVVHKGIRYEQLRRPQESGFQQGGGVIAAIDVASSRQLWAVQLYETEFDPKEERDAQEVYVSDLAIDAKAQVLIATDERRRRWQIKLADGSASLLPAQSEGPPAQGRPRKN